MLVYIIIINILILIWIQLYVYIYFTARLVMRCYIVVGAVGVCEDRSTRGCGGFKYDIKSKIRLRVNIDWNWIK